MNWDAIGAIAELIGATAVVLTLAYLAVQIRQNTKAVRSSAVDSSISSVNDVRKLMAQDAELTDIYVRGNADPSSLNENETMRYVILLQLITWTAWNARSQAKFGDADVWDNQKRVAARIFSTEGGAWYLDNFSDEIEAELLKEIRQILSESVNSQDGT